MVDTRDLKSLGHCGRVGSSPTLGTVVDWQLDFMVWLPAFFVRELRMGLACRLAIGVVKEKSAVATVATADDNGCCLKWGAWLRPGQAAGMITGRA